MGCVKFESCVDHIRECNGSLKIDNLELPKILKEMLSVAVNARPDLMHQLKPIGFLIACNLYYSIT
jgi:hypothetical protein